MDKRPQLRRASLSCSCTKRAYLVFAVVACQPEHDISRDVPEPRQEVIYNGEGVLDQAKNSLDEAEPSLVASIGLGLVECFLRNVFTECNWHLCSA